MAQVTLRMFAAARVAAGTGTDRVEGETVGTVLDVACQRYGQAFADVLAGSKVWLNGEPVGREAPLGPGDEVAILPPVSGG